jgi:NADPH:quinone reductase-like Zn-dependent oxidoreductase
MSPVPATAIRCHQYGEPLDVLREERVEVADPAAGRVRVRVAAVGLNPADWEFQCGHRDPRWLLPNRSGLRHFPRATVEEREFRRRARRTR